MQSFQTQYSRGLTLTNDNSSTNTTLIKSLLNESEKLICVMRKWWFLEIVKTKTTVASQQGYEIPVQIRKLIDLYILVGTTKYMPYKIESYERWKQILASNLGESDAAQFTYRLGSQVLIEPTPATSSNTIYFIGRKVFKDRTADDYTTGTASVNNNATTVTGAGGASFTAAMVGRFIKFTDGDGLWYEIASRTDSTHVELTKPYAGGSNVSGSAFTIGEMSLLPEGYEDASLWRSLAIYWDMQGETKRAERYWRLYDGGYEAGLLPPNSQPGGLIGAMLEDQGEKFEGNYISPENKNVLTSAQTILTPNNYPDRASASSFT